MSNLSELLPTGGGQNAVDFVASGTLSSGQAVVLKANGTVSAVTTSNVSDSVSSAYPYSNTRTTSGITGAVYDSANNKIVLFYSGPSVYGYAVVGTVSGTSISFGTPVVFKSGNTNRPSAAYNVQDGKILVVWRSVSDSNEGKARVGTVSGTSISFGAEATFLSGAWADYTSCVYMANCQKIAVAYKNRTTDISYVTVATISGTSVSFSSGTSYASSTSNINGQLIYDPDTEQIIIFYLQSSQGLARVGSSTGGNPSFGSSVVFSTNTAYEDEFGGIAATYDTVNQKVFVTWLRSTNRYGYIIYGTVSTNSISFGTSTTYSSTATKYPAMVFDPSAGKAVLCYSRTSDDTGFGLSITFTGSGFSKSSTTTFNPDQSRYIQLVYHPVEEKVIVDGDNYTPSPYNFGNAYVWTTAYTQSDYTSFIGITAEAIANTATGAVNVYGGINEAQTGLTIGADYYVQVNGSLSTTASAVKVGQAISATTINMMDLT